MESWLKALARGSRHAAWDGFIGRYRRLILAVIGKFSTDSDARMDMFAYVCERFRANDMARLAAFDPGRGANPATWVVVNVRSMCLDWLRSTHGRHRSSRFLERLSADRRAIFEALAYDRLSYREAFESPSIRKNFNSFAEFLREVRALFAEIGDLSPRLAQELIGLDAEQEIRDQTDAEVPRDQELAHDLTRCLDQLPPDVRSAVIMYVIEEKDAGRVASLVGWPNGKAVYNRVYRALARLRECMSKSSPVGRITEDR